MDRAWRAPFRGVAQSQTRLKRFSTHAVLSKLCASARGSGWSYQLETRSPTLDRCVSHPRCGWEVVTLPYGRGEGLGWR